MYSEEETGIKSNRSNYIMKIICHGGAGHTPKVQDGVDRAAEEGWKILKNTDNALLAATAATIVMEDDFRFNAGTGSCLRDDGRVQNDAAVATSDGKIGAITNLQDFKNPVLVARELLPEFVTMLAGEGAIQFALEKGFKKTKVAGLTGESDVLTGVAENIIVGQPVHSEYFSKRKFAIACKLIGWKGTFH